MGDLLASAPLDQAGAEQAVRDGERWGWGWLVGLCFPSPAPLGELGVAKD